MNGKIHIHSRKIETVKKQVKDFELKKYNIWNKNSLDRLNSRMEMNEERISELDK